MQHGKKNHTNNEKYVAFDLEAIARIAISDIEFILVELNNSIDPGLRRVLIETAVTKTASVYQLFMKACNYCEIISRTSKDETMKRNRKYFTEILQSTKNRNPKKPDSTPLGRVAHARDQLFHNGIGFLNRVLIYPFGIIEGQGFVGVRVRRGGKFTIKGFCVFNAVENEFAITSEGIFEIHNPTTATESWKLFQIDEIILVSKEIDFVEIIKGSIFYLKEIWSELISKMKNDNGEPIISFPNGGGRVHLTEKDKDGQIVTYSFSPGDKIEVKGDLTTTPPSKLDTFFEMRDSSKQSDSR